MTPFRSDGSQSYRDRIIALAGVLDQLIAALHAQQVSEPPWLTALVSLACDMHDFVAAAEDPDSGDLQDICREIASVLADLDTDVIFLDQHPRIRKLHADFAQALRELCSETMDKTPSPQPSNDQPC